MSRLKTKSDLNFDAAQLLLNKNLYAPSVHCSYYSCFQLIKYTIKSFFSIDYDDLSSRIATSKQKTHAYVIRFMTDEIRSLGGIEESREFNRAIKDLKQFREESDYEDVLIDIASGDKALRKAQELRYYISTKFE